MPNTINVTYRNVTYTLPDSGDAWIKVAESWERFYEKPMQREQQLKYAEARKIAGIN